MKDRSGGRGRGLSGYESFGPERGVIVRVSKLLGRHSNGYHEASEGVVFIVGAGERGGGVIGDDGGVGGDLLGRRLAMC